jgi:hypothetical protein
MLDFAQRALRHDPENPEVLSRAAFVLGYFGEDIHTAIVLICRCFELNSNHAMGWYRSGVLRNWAGKPAVALRHFDRYLELNARGRFATYLTAISISLFLCGRFEESVAKMRECFEHGPDHTVVCRFLAASYAHLGRLAEAREIVGRTWGPVGAVEHEGHFAIMHTGLQGGLPDVCRAAAIAQRSIWLSARTEVTTGLVTALIIWCTLAISLRERTFDCLREIARDGCGVLASARRGEAAGPRCAIACTSDTSSADPPKRRPLCICNHETVT